MTLACGSVDCGTCRIDDVLSTQDPLVREVAIGGLNEGVAIAIARWQQGVPNGTKYVALYLPEDGGYSLRFAADGGSGVSLSTSRDGGIWLSYVVGYNPTALFVASSRDGFAPQEVARATSLDPAKLTLDERGEPRVAFRQSSQLLEAFPDAGGWSTVVIEPISQWGSYDVGIDVSGVTHLLYYRNRTGSIVYVRRQGASLSSETIEDLPASFPTPLLLGVASDGRVHEFWQRHSQTGPLGRYAVRDSSGRGVWAVGAEFGAATGVEMVGGTPHLALPGSPVGYAVPGPNGAFFYQPLKHVGSGKVADIAADGRGELYVAAVDPTFGTLSVFHLGAKLPDGYASKFDQLATRVCARAAECVGDGARWCFATGGKSACGGNAACETLARNYLWSATGDGGALDVCIAAMESGGCGPMPHFTGEVGFIFSPACDFPE